MKTLRTIWRNIRSLWRRATVKREIDEELRLHLEMRAAENIAAGMAPGEASREARKRFGNVQSVREDCRDIRGASFGETVIQDIRFAMRMLRKNPGFTAVAVLMLALGIGVNTAMFSIVEAVLLRPLPYPNAERLVEICQSHLKDPVLAEHGVSGPNFCDWRMASRSFDTLGMHQWGDFWVTTGEQPRQVRGSYITSDFLTALGIQPMLGRRLLPDDEQAGGVVVLGYKLWQRLFGSDTNLSSKTILVNEKPHNVVGVMPPGFGIALHGQPELWAPLLIKSDLMCQRSCRMGNVIGRLKPGISPGQAQIELNIISRQLADQYPAENKDWSAKIASLHAQMTRHIQTALALMMGVTVFVLLIVCANLGNLLLSRAIVRRKEFAIRASLGAKPWRLIRQVLVESLLLSTLGGSAGLAAVASSQNLLTALLSSRLPRFAVIEVDGMVWLYGLLVALATGFVCVQIPAWRIVASDLNPILKVGGSQNTADRSCGWFRSAFVVTDVALTMVLLICAGLALRSVYYLSHSSLDVDPAKLVVFEMQLPKTQYPNYSIQRTQFFEDLLTQIEALPGVEAAATSMFTPFSDRTMIPVTLPGGNTLPGKTTLWAGMSSISPGFFKALGLPLVQGRTFTSEDRKGAPEVAVVNETMARQFWPGEDPIGKKLANNVESATSWITVIGVVRDLRVGGVQSSHTPDLYLCSSQLPFYETLLVRTSTKPTRIIAQIQSLVRNLNKRVPADGICTLDRLLSDEMNDSRLLGQLLGVFSGMALLLTVVGIYGVISFTAAQRTHEFGLRLALGAQKSDVAMLVLNRGGRLALAGVLLGLGLAWGLTRLMAGLIEGVSPTDPATFASVAMLVVAVAMLSCWLPARRATNIDPMAALRCE